MRLVSLSSPRVNLVAFVLRYDISTRQETQRGSLSPLTFRTVFSWDKAQLTQNEYQSMDGILNCYPSEPAGFLGASPLISSTQHYGIPVFLKRPSCKQLQEIGRRERVHIAGQLGKTPPSGAATTSRVAFEFTTIGGCPSLVVTCGEDSEGAHWRHCSARIHLIYGKRSRRAILWQSLRHQTRTWIITVNQQGMRM